MSCIAREVLQAQTSQIGTLLRSCELESKLLKGDYIWGSIGEYHRVIKENTRSLDYGSYGGYGRVGLDAQRAPGT